MIRNYPRIIVYHHAMSVYDRLIFASSKCSFVKEITIDEICSYLDITVLKTTYMTRLAVFGMTGLPGLDSPYKKDRRWCAPEILKRTPNRYQDPVHGRGLIIFHP